jgi:flagellar basal-body rod protein FlgG
MTNRGETDMLYGMYTSGNGMRVQMRRQDVISNNLANTNTTGFKRNLFNVQEMGSENENIGRMGSSRNEMLDKFGGPQIHSTRVSFEQGNMESTDNELDLAIEGEGFFKLKNPATGEFSYTRSGHFSMNKDGQLVGADSGHLVMDQRDTPIVVSELQGSASDAVKVVSFNDLGSLQKQEGTMFKLNKNQSGQLPTEMPVTSKVYSGFLENSNTNSINEMVQMIEAHRAYQANASNLKQQDENLGSLISIARS